MKAILVFSLFILCSCSSSIISDLNTTSTNQSVEAQVDLTNELSNLPGVLVRGNGRLASIKLSCGSDPSFVLNGQLEPDYSYIYDRVKAGKLKTLRIQNLSDAAMFGLRSENSKLIIVQTE